jgi:hypothetical protein
VKQPVYFKQNVKHNKEPLKLGTPISIILDPPCYSVALKIEVGPQNIEDNKYAICILPYKNPVGKPKV